jgi:arsenate reductase-like glutaredoxin family protein
MSEQLEKILDSFGERYSEMQHELAQFYFGKAEISAEQFDHWLEQHGPAFKMLINSEPDLVAEYAVDKGTTLRKVHEKIDSIEQGQDKNV